MIEKYYNGAVEQVLAGLGEAAHNYLLVRYSGDFSVRDLTSIQQARAREDIFFSGV